MLNLRNTIVADILQFYQGWLKLGLILDSTVFYCIIWNHAKITKILSIFGMQFCSIPWHLHNIQKMPAISFNLMTNSWYYLTKLKVLKRRTLVPEQWLLLETHRLSQTRQSSLSVAQKERLTLRLVSELSEFLLPRQLQPEEVQGRTSGDLNWRVSRGEVGNSRFNPIVWTPSEQEVNSGELTLEYSTSLDQYIRRSDGNKTYQKWSSGVFQADSVFRKVEHDWKMSYLARSGNNPL